MFKPVRSTLLRLTVTGLFLAACSAGAAAQGVKQALTAPRFDQTPVIDGKLDDPAWVEASTSGAKVVVDVNDSGSALTAYPRVAYVGYDANNLYVAFTIFSPAPNNLAASVTSRDGQVWNDDEVEVFLQPKGKAVFYQIIANAGGAVYDGEHQGLGGDWNTSGKIATLRDGIRWTVEMALPFADFGVKPQAGDEWGLNLNGHQVNDGDTWLAWNATFGGFVNPAVFGALVFGK